MPTTPGMPVGLVEPSTPGPGIAATGFRVTGKPNTVITFAFTVGEGAAYKYNRVRTRGSGQLRMRCPFFPLASSLITSASHQHDGSMGPDVNGFRTVTCGPTDEYN